jgi:hypothetical protein
MVPLFAERVRAFAVTATVLAAACVVVACTAVGSRHATPSATPLPADVVVLHTNDVWGETKPCG